MNMNCAEWDTRVHERFRLFEFVEPDIYPGLHLLGAIDLLSWCHQCTSLPTADVDYLLSNKATHIGDFDGFTLAERFEGFASKAKLDGSPLAFVASG